MRILPDYSVPSCSPSDDLYHLTNLVRASVNRDGRDTIYRMLQFDESNVIRMRHELHQLRGVARFQFFRRCFVAGMDNHLQNCTRNSVNRNLVNGPPNGSVRGRHNPLLCYEHPVPFTGQQSQRWKVTFWYLVLRVRNVMPNDDGPASA